MKKLFFISLCSLFITSYGAEQQTLAEQATSTSKDPCYYTKSILFSSIVHNRTTTFEVKIQEINTLLDRGFDATIINPITGKLPLTELFSDSLPIYYEEDSEEKCSLFLGTIKNIIEKGHADINQQDHQGSTALLAFFDWIIEDRTKEECDILPIIPIFDYLMSLNPDHSKRTNRGQTVMHKMALIAPRFIDNEQFGLNWMKKLLKQGADINAQDENSQTPLILLIKEQECDIPSDQSDYVFRIESFIDNDANPLLCDCTGHNALHLLAKNHRWENLGTYLSLQKYSHGAGTLATEKRYSLLDYILNFVFTNDFIKQINSLDFDGIHEFSEKNFVECIDLCAQQNCPIPDPGLNSSYASPFGNPIHNRSKLHYAVVMTVPSLFKKITTADKSLLERTDSKGNTPLISACQQLFTPIGQEDQQQQDDFKERRKKDSEQCVTHLLALGANPNAQNVEGNTPLHIAVGTKNLGALKALLTWNKTTETKKTG